MGPFVPQRPRSILARAAFALVATALGACADYSGLPESESGPYDGPPIVGESGGTDHVLVARLPAPGYEFTLDGTREAFQSQDVFVTLRRPNPAVLYSSVPVEQRLATGVPTRTTIRVFARVVDFGARDGSGHREALTMPAVAPTRRDPRAPAAPAAPAK